LFFYETKKLGGVYLGLSITVKIRVKHKKERLGRNPKTKQEAIISARKIIKFTASKRLISRINSLQHTQKYRSLYNQ